jgi:O-antigen/teichoic acid export membrane protein
MSAASSFGMMGIASLVGGGWLAVRLRLSRLSLVNSAFVHETFERHWSYGRWSVATYMLTWAPENAYYLLLPLWGGLEASAALKALMNLFLPLLRFYTAVSPLLITTLMRVREQAQFDRLVRNFLILFSCSAVFYWILISLFHRSLISWLYGDQYREYTNLLWLLGASLLPAGVIAVFSGALRALERPDQLFWAYTLSTLVVLTCGLGLTVTYGIVGAVSGLCLAGAVAAVAMGVSYQRLRRSHLY